MERRLDRVKAQSIRLIIFEMDTPGGALDATLKICQAIKTLRDDLSAQPGMTQRFKREALLLSSVDHPSVVRVIDFGEASSTYVLVMEFVEGENLALSVREGAFEPARAIPVLKDIAEGLEAIHFPACTALNGLCN